MCLWEPIPLKSEICRTYLRSWVIRQAKQYHCTIFWNTIFCKQFHTSLCHALENFGTGKNCELSKYLNLYNILYLGNLMKKNTNAIQNRDNVLRAQRIRRGCPWVSLWRWDVLAHMVHTPNCHEPVCLGCPPKFPPSHTPPPNSCRFLTPVTSTCTVTRCTASGNSPSWKLTCSIHRRHRAGGRVSGSMFSGRMEGHF